MYYQDDKSDFLNTWKLPEKIIDDTTTNQYLQNAIAGIYEQFEDTLKAQSESESENARDVILKRLPYSISEPIRKLLAPSNNDSEQKFFDRSSDGRFHMLKYGYRSILAFVSFVLLAQLWQLKRKEDNNIDTDSIGNFLKQWIKSD